MARSPELLAHLEWIGYVQPVGLVVSVPALAAAGAYVDRNIVPKQQVLSALIRRERVPGDRSAGNGKIPVVDFPALAQDLLGWEPTDLAGAPGGPELPPSLEARLSEYGETLAPTYAVPDPDEPRTWLLLVEVVPAACDLDAPLPVDDRCWRASPEARFERLLRENGVPTGLLTNGTAIRLVHAPRGESSGHITFPVEPMAEVAGRPILSALCMLLSAERLFTLPPKQRLPAILQESRKYQNEVSTALAEQVLTAMHELLRGFQAADEATKGRLLGEVLSHEPSHIYGGLLSTILRLVFVLYAEDRGLLPGDDLYQEHYSVTGLFAQLREDASRYPDTMDQRYGAWARLLTLFRLIYDGAAHGTFRMPPRQGRLFDPDAYPFLEGRPLGSHWARGDAIDPPAVSDGVVYKVLTNLLMLNGERLSYRALDVEQIGSVYEGMMGFALEVAPGPAVALKPHHVVVGLQDLLDLPAARRAAIIKEVAGCEVAGKALDALKGAATLDDLVAALGPRLSPRTQRALPPGAMYLQPTEERRRTGSHYTPRSLTEPIVETTLRPVLAALGDRPRPEQILDLKVCDPAMGSGAFLVAACRLLADRLVAAWQTHGAMPEMPPDQDPVLHARRLVAQHCLYGVDKNPFAVDLAKLSLWLATLAKNHPFTFLDHALRQGDSLVGLTREQIARFHWDPEPQIPTLKQLVDRALKEAESLRHEIRALADSDDTAAKIRLLRQADEATADVRLVGDLAIAAFFGAAKKADRERLLRQHADKIGILLAGSPDIGALDAIAHDLRSGNRPVTPFHWEIEFPEVFSRANPGFDAVVGNPPFAGKNTITAGNRDGYVEYLQVAHEESHGCSDLVAHFYRRAFDKLRSGGAFGLIATKTIAQGDTRSTGLRWICTHGGTIYEARKRIKWPGVAAVVVSVVHVAKGAAAGPCLLDGREVPKITAFLFHAGGHNDPARLRANAGKSFQGSIVLGMGFTFDDNNPDATPIAEMHRLIAKDPRNAERIFPYIGGEEVNESPTHAHRRYVINFGDMTEEDARRWPDLMAIVEAKVKPQRLGDKREAYRRYWWRFAERRGELHEAIRGLRRVMACSFISKHPAFVLAPAGHVFSHNVGVFALDRLACFCVIQSRAHLGFAAALSSTLEDRLGYRPSDCFETFPFPPAYESSPTLEDAGRAYYDFRAALMVKNNQGLTATYNRFHDPEERDPEIIRLRELHDAMDRAVLDAYGWTDIRPTCEFLLEYEDDAEDDDTAGRPRRRKKPYRYRWPDDIKDEVLARLLALNQERAASESLTAPPPGTKSKAGRGGGAGTSRIGQRLLGDQGTSPR